MKSFASVIPAAMVLALTPLICDAQRSQGAPVKPQDISYYAKHFNVEQIRTLSNARYSPDGNWLSFDGSRDGIVGKNIWVMRGAGSVPVQLTTGAHMDSAAAWFPSGDKLAFLSNRTHGVMSIAFDPRTGRAVGPVQRVTLDSAIRWMDVSADGKSIAYVSDSSGVSRIRIVPSTGGSARQIATLLGLVRSLRYDRDGKLLYFNHVPGGGARANVSRVPTAGGAVEIVTILPGSAGVLIDPMVDRILMRQNNTTANILDLRGDTVAAIGWAEGISNVQAYAFTRDGQALITSIGRVSNEVHAVPLDGRPVRVIGRESGAFPFAWVSDRIYYSIDTNKFGFMNVSSDGKQRSFMEVAPKDIKFPGSRILFDAYSPDGRFWQLFVRDSATLPGPGKSLLYWYDSQTRTTRPMPANNFTDIYVPGGMNHLSWSTTVGNEWIYGVADSTSVELRAMKFTGETRHLRRITGIDPENTAIAYAPDRIAYYTDRDSVVTIFVVDSSATREVYRKSQSEVGELIFSPDARTLFVRLGTGAGPNRKQQVVFLNFRGDGTVMQPVRALEIMGNAEYPQWTRDGRAVLFTALLGNQSLSRSDVLRVPAQSGPPQLVSHRETAPFSGFIYSPDGREIVVAAEKSLGSQLWKIDLLRAPKKITVVASSQVHLLDLATGAVKSMSTPGVHALAPSWSPDGRRLAMQSGNGVLVDIVVMNADGSGRRTYPVATDRMNGFNNAQDTGPAWSADGRTIAFHSNMHRQLTVLDLASGQTRTLNNSGLLLGQIAWRPDGRSIVAFRQLPSSPTARPEWSIVELALDGSERTLRLLRDAVPGVIANELRMMSDSIAMVSTGTGAAKEMLVLRTAGGSARRIALNLPVGSTGGAAGKSQDGMWAFNRVVSAGKQSTQAVSVTGEIRSVSISVGTAVGGFQSTQILPDGKNLLLVVRAPETGTFRLYLVPLNGDPPRLFDLPSVGITNRTGGKVSPDGKLFVFTTEGEAVTIVR